MVQIGAEADGGADRPMVGPVELVRSSNGWADGWAGRADGWADDWAKGWADWWADGWADGWSMGGPMVGPMEGPMGGPMVGPIGRWYSSALEQGGGMATDLSLDVTRFLF